MLIILNYRRSTSKNKINVSICGLLIKGNMIDTREFHVSRFSARLSNKPFTFDNPKHQCPNQYNKHLVPQQCDVIKLQYDSINRGLS